MKNVLKNHIAEANPQLTFHHLEAKGANITDIKNRYAKAKAFEEKLISEKKQYTSAEYQSKTNQFNEDNRTLLELIDKYF